MSDVVISPNMGMPVPIVGQDPGPDWANNINACLGILDQHTHAPGQGLLVTPTGLNINTDLSIESNNLTMVKTVNFTAQVASLPGTSPNLGCIYVAGNELVYNDEIGNVVPITNNGSVNSGAGSITGLPSGTASASYSSGGQKFIWQSATNTPASMDFGSAILRNIVANSKGLTLNPPNAMGADYTLNLPSLPGTTSFLTLDTSGNISGSISTTAGITGSMIAPQTITQDLIAPMTSGQTVGVGGIAISPSCGNFTNNTGLPTDVTNLTITITTTGRPVYIQLVSALNQNGYVEGSNGGTGNIQFELNLVRDVTHAWGNLFASVVAGTTSNDLKLPPSSVSHIDTDVNGSPGTYTYKYQVTANGGLITFNEVQMVAYEI